jgi:hypothetical protein
MDELRTETGVGWVGNKDNKHMKKEREERDWQVGFRWIAKKRS